MNLFQAIFVAPLALLISILEFGISLRVSERQVDVPSICSVAHCYGAVSSHFTFPIFALGRGSAFRGSHCCSGWRSFLDDWCNEPFGSIK